MKKKWRLIVVLLLITVTGYFLFDKKGSVLSQTTITPLVKSYRITGTSMEPEYKNGEMVAIDGNIYKKTVPKQGDVIAFKFEYAKDARVKRVVAVPGDQLLFLENQILVNGKKVSNIIEYNKAVWKINKPTLVPENLYFVLSDNPSNFEDSRKWGYVPAKAILGKVIK